MDAVAFKHHEDETSNRSGGETSRRLGWDRRSCDETQPLLVSRSRVEAQTCSHDHSPENELEDRVLRKIDRTIIPLLFITYMLNFMDKTILSTAAVFGLPEDNVSTKTHPLQPNH